MEWSESTRRSCLKQFGAAGAAALAVTKAEGLGMGAQAPAAPPAPTPTDQKQIATRDARMAWWHEAKFGMFIHWGLYSIIGQHEWVKEHEGVPIPQYEILARHHHPKPNAARDWARLARRAGQK
jgi:alpha-L-fucosidase